MTNAQYRMCVESGACQPPTNSRSLTRDGYYGNARYDGYPVIYISWYDAQKYCAWASRRLPTEAEWEKAARGMDEREFPWGNWWQASDLLNFCDRNCSAGWNNDRIDDGYADTAPIGSYPKGASPYGALDMAGNVWEWVADWYDETYYQNAPAHNPRGPDAGTYRVLRGGSFNGGWADVGVANRGKGDPYSASNDVSFRCARSP